MKKLLFLFLSIFYVHDADQKVYQRKLELDFLDLIGLAHIRDDDLDEVTKKLNNPINPMVKDKHGNSALIVAARQKHVGICKLIIDKVKALGDDKLNTYINSTGELLSAKA